jgi:hypothetical protein
MRLLVCQGDLVHRLGRNSRRTCAVLGVRRSARWGKTHAPSIATSDLSRLVLPPLFCFGCPRGSPLSHHSAVRQLADAVAAAWLLVARSIRSLLFSRFFSTVRVRYSPRACLLLVVSTRPRAANRFHSHCTGQARLLTVRCPVSLCACVLRSALHSTFRIASSATSPALSRLRHFHARRLTCLVCFPVSCQAHQVGSSCCTPRTALSTRAYLSSPRNLVVHRSTASPRSRSPVTTGARISQLLSYCTAVLPLHFAQPHPRSHRQASVMSDRPKRSRAGVSSSSREDPPAPPEYGSVFRTAIIPEELDAV